MALIQIENGDWINSDCIYRYRIDSKPNDVSNIAIFLDVDIQSNHPDICLISRFEDEHEAGEYLMDLLKKIQDRRIYTCQSVSEFRQSEFDTKELND